MIEIIQKIILGIYLLSFMLYLFSCFLKPKFLPKIGLLMLLIGLAGNLFLISKYFFQTGRLPLTNTSETLMVGVTVMVFVFLLFCFKNQQIKASGVLVSLLSYVGMFFSLVVLKGPVIPLLPALRSRWLVFHVSSCIIAYGFFAVAFILAIIYLIKHKKSEIILLFMHRFTCIGFLFLTAGIILGSIWGKSAWGHWWNWDPKEVWALASWLIYAGYFYGLIREKLPMRVLCILLILGFLSCLFTYLGVNFLLKGLHSYG